MILFASWFQLDEADAGGLGLSLDLVEFFAGCSRIARFGRRQGLRTRAHEILFDKSKRGFKKNWTRKRSCFDLNGEAGYTNLSQFSFKCCHQPSQSTYEIAAAFQTPFVLQNVSRLSEVGGAVVPGMQVGSCIGYPSSGLYNLHPCERRNPCPRHPLPLGAGLLSISSIVQQNDCKVWYWVPTVRIQASSRKPPLIGTVSKTD